MRGKIYIAEKRGFCTGVKLAIKTVENAVEKGPYPVRVLHEIVHNEHVVQSFKDRKVEFVDSLDPAWTGGTLIFSAHGVSEEIENQAKSMNVALLDATCPLVKEIHRTAAELEREGFHILLLGQRSHREIEGVIGRVKNPPVVLENKEEALEFQPEKGCRYACLTQTTLNVDDCSEIFEILKKKIPDIRIRSGICNATTQRQNAVRKLAEQCSRILVIGSVRSSNSRKLRQTAEAAGVPAILISSVEDLPEDFLKDGDIGLTLGASAPEYLLQEVIGKLVSLGWETAEHDAEKQAAAK